MSFTFIFRPFGDLDEVPAIRIDGSEDRQRDAIRRWAETTGHLPVTTEIDFEHWHENAAKLFAAVDSGYPVQIMQRDDLLTIARCLNGASDRVQGPVAVIGCHMKGDPLLRRSLPGDASPRTGWKNHMPGVEIVWPDLDQNRLAARYATMQAFVERAGRRVLLTDMPGVEKGGADTEGPASLHGAIRQMADTGASSLILKIVAQQKYAAPVEIDIWPGMTEADIDSALFDALEYALAHLSGEKDAVLVQEKVSMQSEYRIFVIDGRPVTGAGCIEAFTPLHAQVHPFDDQVESGRSGGEIRRDPDLLTRYLKFAEEACAAFTETGLLDYTLDLATDENGNILIVELNPSANAGLFACATDSMISATISAIETRMGISAGHDP